MTKSIFIENCDIDDVIENAMGKLNQGKKFWVLPFKKIESTSDALSAACRSISKRKEIYSASKFRILRLSETNPLRTMENNILIFRIYF